MRFLIVTAVLLVFGCAAAPSKTIETKADLSSIAMQYHQFVAENDVPPASQDELASFADPYASLPGNQAASSRCEKALNSGDYVVIWSYDVAEDLARNGNLILAYHKRVPMDGGYVAFADGMTTLLSKDEFASTGKAEPQSAAP